MVKKWCAMVKNYAPRIFPRQILKKLLLKNNEMGNDFPVILFSVVINNNNRVRVFKSVESMTK